MGKHGKKQAHHQNRRGRPRFSLEEEEYPLNPPPHHTPRGDDTEEELEEEQELEENDGESNQKESSMENDDVPSKFLLYQQSVQSPKGDISYLQKFFLMYVGGRFPLHLQEDFCGTALLSAEWLRSDARRTAVGLDLDHEALNWCLGNNVNKIGTDICSRIFLFHGNVLQPLGARFVNTDPGDLILNISLKDNNDETSKGLDHDATRSLNGASCGMLMKDVPLPARDIVCAFNYSCCCLHSRQELILYFKHTLNILNKKGGMFVMDLYGGTSSERGLRLQRRFPNFTYIWEQAEFDIVKRITRISLHFNLKEQKRKLRHAFSYSWRLWSLPEIKDCLEEAGFRSVHFWIRNMPDSEEIRSVEGLSAGRDIKYEEVTSFQQQDSWNAYVVAVA